MLNIDQANRDPIALLQLGFRPFFISASLFSVISVLLWFLAYQFGEGVFRPVGLSTLQWHAHEMIYGYTLAVIAGFLLTAVRNWTGQQTLRGLPLMFLTLSWLLARIMPFIDHPTSIYAMATLDILFTTWLCIALFIPLFKAKQWLQLGLWSKIVLLLVAHIFFYLGVFGLLQQGMRWGLYGGLYLIISLILLMGRRVIPFFIEKGISPSIRLMNRKWVDLSSLTLMVVFLILEVFLPYSRSAAVVSALLCALHAIRLYDWHHSEIWGKPLLWILYMAYVWIVIGFALRALMPALSLPPLLILHAFAVGGIGSITLGMMARVALGHTGRTVFDPPSILPWIFFLVLCSAISRVLLPLILPNLYPIAVGMSQILWIGGFALFCWVYIPMLLQPRIDGRTG
jgi:uncharacterized protein involved in response to NO